MLQHFIYSRASALGLSFMQPHLATLGQKAAGLMNPLSLRADKQPPKHIKRDFYGQNIDYVEFHPDYWQLAQIAIAALSAARRALAEAYQFLSFRSTFGKNALQHALVRTKLWELSALTTASFYLSFRTIAALDAAENGDHQEQQLLRLLTPMLKKATAQDAVYVVRESMELMGGLGYIEDGVMPKIMRDVMVLPIWEGAGNIMLLDMLRASSKSEGLALMLAEIEAAINTHSPENLPQYEQLKANIKAALAQVDTDLMQVAAKTAFEQLTRWYQFALLLKAKDEDSQAWIQPALDYWKNNYLGLPSSLILPSVEDTQAAMAWRF